MNGARLFSFCALAAISGLYPFSAHAMHPDKHAVITRLAFAEYRDCLRALSVEDTLSPGVEAVAEYSGLEDISPLLERFLNWHFYDAYRDTGAAMGTTMFGSEKSLHRIYDQRIASLLDALEDADAASYYEYTGRILHFIQDMTVPAHVAPIYHYKFIWFDKSDYFDEMAEWENTGYTKPQDLCVFERVHEDDLKVQLNLVLDETAFRTRDRVRQDIPVPQGHRLHGKTWQVFWVIRDPADDDTYGDVISGFAPYGSEGNEGFAKLCGSTGDDRRLCLDFFRRSFDDAITYTVKVLLTINQIRLNEPS